MTSFTTRLLRAALVLAALSFSAPAAPAQERTREEAIKEAGRLITEAMRLSGEAYRKVQAGGDRGLMREAERATAERFRRALELWRAAGDDRRLYAGAEELSRLYSVLGDYEATVGGLNREIEYWGQRGDLARQAHLVWLLGLRQKQMDRDAAALETFERAAEMARAAALPGVERNAVEDLARLYEKSGRRQEAERLRAREKELWSQIQTAPPPAEVQTPAPPAVIPAQWIDLRSAPLAAEYLEVDGVRQAVLVNRSPQGIEMVTFGCVAEEGGKARVLYQLMGQGVNHGGVRPGSYYAPFTALNGPLNPWTDERMGCEGSARMAVTEAFFADRTKWQADGAPWAAR